MSDPDARLRRLRELFDAAMEQPPETREAWLAAQTGWESDVVAEVRALAAQSEVTDPRLDRPLLPSDRFDAGGETLGGRRLGPYDIVRMIGLGGMGAVYEAVRADDQYEKRVAVKLVQGSRHSAVTLARFRRERQILAGLEHPNIAVLLDGGVSPDGRPFLVMEYVEGEPITRWCDTRALTLRQRLSLFRQVCAAVEYAHRNLVIHRDLKPGNILVTDEGSVKLLDFGVARMIGPDAADDALPVTRDGTRAFTPEYASPEQIRGEGLSTASDVYSMGVVLYELLAGRRPHVAPGGSAAAVERAVLDQPAPAPGAAVTDEAARARGERTAGKLRRRLSGDLESLVLMALRPEPEFRYRSAEALGSDIGNYLDGLPVAARRGRMGYRLRKFVGRNRAAATATVLLLLALAGGMAAREREAARARIEQHKTERINAFLQGLLRSVKPETGGRDVPVSELLDAAALRIQSELAGERAVRAELETVIGQSYLSLARYDEAAEHLGAALRLHQTLDGPRSRAAAAALNELGAVPLMKGDYAAADSLFRAGLRLRESMGAAPDTLLAALLDNVGSVAHYRGEIAEAESLHSRALDIRMRLLGPGSDAVAYSMNNVAIALGEMNRWAEAESLLRRVVAIVSANHPEPNTLKADAENSLASALDIQNKYAAAESAYVDVLDLRGRLLGTDHPAYAFTAMNYAGFLFDRGRYDEAATWTQKVLALRGRTVPDSHPAIATALQTLGRCLDRLGRTDEAGRALEESLALRRRNLSPDSWLIASSEGVLGEHYTALRDYPRAEALLLDAGGILRRSLGADHPRTVTNDRRLAALYDAWGRPAKAGEIRTRLPGDTGG